MAALALLFIVLVAPGLFTGAPLATSEAKDEVRHHLPVIVTMAEQWPRVDLVNYDSATTPGYHLLMAVVWRASGGELMWLRTLSSLFGLGLMVVVYRLAARFAPAWGALALVLPLLCCQSVLSGAIWLTTDNLALLLVALALGGAATHRFTPGRGLALGVVAAAAALLASPLAERGPRWMRPAEGEMLGGGERTWGNLIAGALGAAAPVALVAVFAVMWNGLIPNSPLSREFHGRGPNPATFAFGLALFGGCGVFFAPLALRGRAELRRALGDRWTWLAAAAGLLTAVVVPTSTQHATPGSPPSRGFGALWRIADMAPDVADRSTLIALLAAVGGALALLFYRAAAGAGRRGPAAIVLLSMVAWLCAQSGNSMAWQRYFEPMVLIALAWVGALAVAPGARPRRWVWAGPVALAAAELGGSALAIYMPLWR